jgi:hypothetical protein
VSAALIAVAGQDVGTCQALRWAWLSIKPMVVAQGDDAERVLADGIEAAGHDDVCVFTRDGEQIQDGI